MAWDLEMTLRWRAIKIWHGWQNTYASKVMCGFKPLSNTYPRVCVCVCVFVCVCLCVWSMDWCLFLHMHAGMYVCMCVYMHARIYWNLQAYLTYSEYFTILSRWRDVIPQRDHARLKCGRLTIF